MLRKGGIGEGVLGGGVAVEMAVAAVVGEEGGCVVPWWCYLPIDRGDLLLVVKGAP